MKKINTFTTMANECVKSYKQMQLKAIIKELSKKKSKYVTIELIYGNSFLEKIELSELDYNYKIYFSVLVEHAGDTIKEVLKNNLIEDFVNREDALEIAICEYKKLKEQK